MGERGGKEVGRGRWKVGGRGAEDGKGGCITTRSSQKYCLDLAHF